MYGDFVFGLTVLYVCNHLAEDNRAGCFAMIICLLSYRCPWSVSLPRGAVVSL